MKAVLAILLALCAGLLSFFLMRSHKMEARHEVLLDSISELSWIKTELGATDAQLAKVTELHLAYRPKCEELCHRISTAHAKVEEISRKSRVMTPELEDAIRERAETHAECQQEMMEHIYQTAALLDPAQATRFIEAVLPIALDYTQPAAPHSAK